MFDGRGRRAAEQEDADVQSHRGSLLPPPLQFSEADLTQAPENLVALQEAAEAGVLPQELLGALPRHGNDDLP